MSTATRTQAKPIGNDTVVNTAANTVEQPDFIRKMISQYVSKIAHIFVIHGNINDFSDNSEANVSVPEAITLATDSNKRSAYGLPKGRITHVQEITGEYNISSGLRFSIEQSQKEFEKFITEHVPKAELENWPIDWKNPVDQNVFFFVMNNLIAIQQKLLQDNIKNEEAGRNKVPELRLTLVISDADVIFPDGPIVNISGDRQAIVHLRNWARNEYTGPRLRVILLTRYLKDIHESIRGLPMTSGIDISKPSCDDRLIWLKNFDRTIIEQVKESKAAGNPLTVNSILIPEGLQFEVGFGIDQFAIQSAGMSRIQLRNTIFHQIQRKIPIGFDAVREMKQKAVHEEYDGIVDFEEPTHGFDEIGGHAKLKEYFQKKIIIPLQNGDTRRASSGVLLTGPPGTGKSKLAMALAKESKMNFMVGHLSRLFGGLVGETEQKTRKFFEAIESAAPVILFLDEIDSVLSSGRSSAGDSGTSARMFNTLMQFLSDDSRKGKIVVVAASNRPDLLDDAFIRAGRFDAKLPVLPPSKEDWTGRYSIVVALSKKHDIKFDKSFAGTKEDATKGFGLLLQDKGRIWTGAEIELVMKESFDNAYFAGRVHKNGKQALEVTLEDWSKAMDEIIPNTGAVEQMTDLSLLYVDHLGYLSGEWREKAKDKKALKESLIEQGFRFTTD